MNRREFIKGATFAGAGAMFGGCAGFGGRGAAPALAGDFAWGALLHLGFNMWGDWSPLGTYAKSKDEAETFRKTRPEFQKTPAFRKNGADRNIVRGDYLACDLPTWTGLTEEMAKEKLNLIIIDIGEAYCYPSHPELWVNGGFTPEMMRAELKRLRGLGLEPVPKLNFSTGHDIWLKQYHYMTSTRKYYQVVADVIKDVCEVFDWPRYFHIGFDEETYAAVKNRQSIVIRQGELWWHDLEYCIREVERHGARAMMWADKICDGKDAFLKRMTKGVVQLPWYYGTDFSKEKTTWDPSFETKKDWSIQRNLAASIGIIADAGFDVIPCTSNWEKEGASDALVAYCKERIDPARLKGYLTAPWYMTLANQRQKLSEGIRLFAEAKRKHYPLGR